MFLRVSVWRVPCEGSIVKDGPFTPSDAGLVPWGTLPSAPKALTSWKFLGVFGNRDER